MLQSPDPARPQLSVTKDGHLMAGPFPWSGALTFADGGQIGLAAVNTAPPTDGLALYTPDSGAATPLSTRTDPFPLPRARAAVRAAVVSTSSSWRSRGR